MVGLQVPCGAAFSREPCCIFSGCCSEPDRICTGIHLSVRVSSWNPSVPHPAQPWPDVAFCLLQLSCLVSLVQVPLNGDLGTAEHCRQPEWAKEGKTQPLRAPERGPPLPTGARATSMPCLRLLITLPQQYLPPPPEPRCWGRGGRRAGCILRVSLFCQDSATLSLEQSWANYKAPRGWSASRGRRLSRAGTHRAENGGSF